MNTGTSVPSSTARRICHAASLLSASPPATRRWTHDPAMLPNCENSLISDRHTVRFDGGRGNELLIHAYITTNPAYDCAMRKLSQFSFSAMSPEMNKRPLQRHVARHSIHSTDGDDEANDARGVRANHVIEPLLLPVRVSNHSGLTFRWLGSLQINLLTWITRMPQSP